MRRTYHRSTKVDPLLYSPHPEQRLGAARAPGQAKRARRALADRIADWPPYSPGAVNAWLLLVTTKPPSWRDPLMFWPELPLTVGEPHEGFFYPDPLGFWGEVRRWSLELLRHHVPTWTTPESLAVTTLLHLGEHPNRLQQAIDLCGPRTVLFLDEPSWDRSNIDVRQMPHHITDPHRPKQVYEGFWGRLDDGRVVGKSPQHPSTHNLYRSEDMMHFLSEAPTPDRD